MWCSSHTRSDDQACGPRSTVMFSSTSRRSTNSTTSNGAIRPTTSSSLTTSFEFSKQASVAESRVTTVFLRQGHYATDVDSLKAYSPADLALDHIGELVDALVEANTLPNR